ncbi:TraR/DksA family transcriptional regulator [Streptomonospora algeriensis]|uniref:TraR/DksA family transcriptional regulator n=1 Tax=Streptomonospora algeriensis TaxID=995084 RepID=A0ABW3BFZ4_9ACTN
MSSTVNSADLPVRPGEDPWTESELAEVRNGLESEIAALRDGIAAAESELAERLSDSVEGAGDDPTDTGAKAYQREHDLALNYNSRELLAQSERAIQRMDAGTYGVCESCGKAIGKARLQAFPRATLCVQCKQREERR